MSYYYKIFGLNCESDIELPALVPISTPIKIDFEVKLVTTELPKFRLAPTIVKPFSSFNEQEFKFTLPEVASYFVRDGKEVWIENHSLDWDSILLFFYSTAVAALLFQRDLIPFHVSGVLDSDGNAWLFSAPSRTGKSTTAMMLQQFGYRLFTDDTCLLEVRDNGIYAVPSYPMMRAWQPTLDQQDAFFQTNAFQLRSEVEKFGIYFHNSFVVEPSPVKGIVFLEKEGEKILVEHQKSSLGLQALGNNIFRRSWISGMGKQVLCFKLITSVAKQVPFFKAVRPERKPSFKEFSQAIHEQILSKNAG